MVDSGIHEVEERPYQILRSIQVVQWMLDFGVPRVGERSHQILRLVQVLLHEERNCQLSVLSLMILRFVELTSETYAGSFLCLAIRYLTEPFVRAMCLNLMLH